MDAFWSDHVDASKAFLPAADTLRHLEQKLLCHYNAVRGKRMLSIVKSAIFTGGVGG